MRGGVVLKLYEAYLQEIIERSKLGLGPKPIDQGNLLEEIINIILGRQSPKRNEVTLRDKKVIIPLSKNAKVIKIKIDEIESENPQKLIISCQHLDEHRQDWIK